MIPKFQMLRRALFTHLPALIFHTFFFFPLILSGQPGDLLPAEAVETFARAESASAADVAAWLERLEADPLDLNAATRDELETLGLLTPLQVQDLLAYRQQFGDFLAVEELQAVPALDVPDVRRLLPFVRVGSNRLRERAVPWWAGFKKGSNVLLCRTSEARALPPDAEGGPLSLSMRYRHQFESRLQYGFTADRDPGEVFGRGSNPKGFDFYSAHFFVRDPHPAVRRLVLGDYTARFGQGLLLQSGFAPGKSAEVMACARGGPAVQPYSAFGEQAFFRGAALSVRMGRQLEWTGFFSRRRRDANLAKPDAENPLPAFTSLQTSGLHRTPAEIQDEGSAKETAFGSSLGWSAGNVELSLNALQLQYNPGKQASGEPYRHFAFSGKGLTGVSLDYRWRRENAFFFGEWARSGNGGLACLNGVMVGLDKKVGALILARMYAPRYQSVYADPVGEISGAVNEHGVLMGIESKWRKRWQLSAYTDIWKHPWLRYGVDKPASGWETLTRLVWTPNKKVSAYVLYTAKTKNDEEKVTRRRFRCHVSAKWQRLLECRGRAEWTATRQAQGSMVYLEALLKPPGSRWSASGRYAVFGTDDYDSRVYAFENDLFSGFSVPGMAGKGARWYINMALKLSGAIKLEGRFEQTRTAKAVTETGSKGLVNGWKIQASWKW